MSDREPNLVSSGLSQRVAKDGISVQVCIYRLEEDKEWTLEVINDAGTSIVWDETYPSDDAAYAEFLRVVEDEGMSAFLDSATVIQFPRRPD